MSEGGGHHAEVAVDLLSKGFSDELDERVVVDGVAEQEEHLPAQRRGGAARLILRAGPVRDDEVGVEVLFGDGGEVLDKIAGHGEGEVPILLDARGAGAAVVVDRASLKVLKQHLHVLQVVAVVRPDGGCGDVLRRMHVGVIVEGYDELVALLKRHDEVMQDGREMCFSGQGQSL